MKGNNGLWPIHPGACRRDSNGFHCTCSSRHSNQIPTKPLLRNSILRHEIGAGLGDQGSQVRVLSPRRTRKLISVQGFPVPSIWVNPAGTGPKGEGIVGSVACANIGQ